MTDSVVECPVDWAADIVAVLEASIIAMVTFWSWMVSAIAAVVPAMSTNRIGIRVARRCACALDNRAAPRPMAFCWRYSRIRTPMAVVKMLAKDLDWACNRSNLKGDWVCGRRGYSLSWACNLSWDYPRKPHKCGRYNLVILAISVDIPYPFRPLPTERREGYPMPGASMLNSHREWWKLTPLARSSITSTATRPLPVLLWTMRMRIRLTWASQLSHSLRPNP